MNFREKFINLRKSNHLSIEKLATKLQISKTRLLEWEEGLVNPSLDELLLIANFFNVSTDYLIKDEIKIGFVFYHNDNHLYEKPLTKNRIVSVILFVLSVSLILSIVAIIILNPLTYTHEVSSIAYRGFLAYWYQSIAFRIAFLFSIILFAFSSIVLIIENRKHHISNFK